jgi:tetratricopeptide (TPR) repeat protein
VRSFIDHGAVVQKEGAFVVTEKIDRMVIPHTINDVLMARIDQLEEKTRDLVKIASVIGRSFFYRILTEVAQTVEDLDNRLSYLKEIQLIRDRRRLDELEYLFKHALAHEAVYESILLQKRKELHLKVADSIEKIFSQRLHEFYGMLAYHYSQGEHLEKAEEYLEKAGEEALRSSASREALSYYRGALDLHLKKYGETADPEKLAMLEKNIAVALFNKGEYEEALVYFDTVFKRLGVKPSRNKIFMLIKFLFNVLMVILKLYFPSKKPKKVPTHRDNDIFSLSTKRDVILVLTNPMRLLVERFGTIKRILKFNIKQIENGFDAVIRGSGDFSFSGLSFRLSKKFLEYGESVIDKNNCLELLPFKFFDLLHKYLSGKWDDIQAYDEGLIDETLKSGQFFLKYPCILICTDG